MGLQTLPSAVLLNELVIACLVLPSSAAAAADLGNGAIHLVGANCNRAFSRRHGNGPGRELQGCLVGDIMYAEGDDMGHIGLECLDKSRYEGKESRCGPGGTILEEDKVFTCPDSVPYCVQDGPRGWGNAFCLSSPRSTAADNDSIVCPDGQNSIPNTFCGRGVDRADCAEDQSCYIDPADRFAVCCPPPLAGEKSDIKKCCDPEAGPGGCPDANGRFDRCWDEGGYCCSDGRWYANESDGSGTCGDKQLEDSTACPSADPIKETAVRKKVARDPVVDSVTSSGATIAVTTTRSARVRVLYAKSRRSIRRRRRRLRSRLVRTRKVNGYTATIQLMNLEADTLYYFLVIVRGGDNDRTVRTFTTQQRRSGGV